MIGTFLIFKTIFFLVKLGGRCSLPSVLLLSSNNNSCCRTFSEHCPLISFNPLLPPAFKCQSPSCKCCSVVLPLKMSGILTHRPGEGFVCMCVSLCRECVYQRNNDIKQLKNSSASVKHNRSS